MIRRVKFIEGSSTPTPSERGRQAGRLGGTTPDSAAETATGTTAGMPSADGVRPAGSSSPADRRLAWLDSMRPFRARHERDVSMESALQAIERELRHQRDTVGDVIDVWNRVAPPAVRDLASVVGVSAGTLTLAVASSGAAYEIGRVLRDGLERQMVQQMPTRVKRIKVRVVSE